jgi:hypothetical protein
MTCVERLAIPRYPPIASSARVSVDGLTASVRLALDGSVQAVVVNSPSSAGSAEKLSYPSVRKSLRASTFRPRCGDRLVSMVFEFRLSAQADEEGRVAFCHPNRFEVFDTTPLVDTKARRP